MKKLIVITLALMLVCGTAFAGDKCGSHSAAKELTIKWQKMVDKDGKSCSHCGATEVELKKALKMFEEKGIKVKLEMVSSDSKDKAKSCAESNHIWLNDKPLSGFVSAEVSKAKCSKKCSGHAEKASKAKCGVMKVDGKTCKSVQSELIFHAGLKSMDMESTEIKPASEIKPAKATTMKGCSKSCSKSCGAAAAACGMKGKDDKKKVEKKVEKTDS
jgi:Domain of unknown function (DUF2703)